MNIFCWILANSQGAFVNTDVNCVPQAETMEPERPWMLSKYNSDLLGASGSAPSLTDRPPRPYPFQIQRQVPTGGLKSQEILGAYRVQGIGSTGPVPFKMRRERLAWHAGLIRPNSSLRVYKKKDIFVASA